MSRILVALRRGLSRRLLPRARELGTLAAADVHAVRELDDAYHQDVTADADGLFVSNELLPCPPAEWADAVVERDHPQVLVTGLGSGGALLSAFVHVYGQTRDPYGAVEEAVLFASYKIGEAGAAEGFLYADAPGGVFKELHAV